MTILTAGDWPAVRAALDVELDDTVLPDPIIALPIFQGEAELDFTRRVAGAVPPIDTTSERAKNACIYLLAARLCPHMARYTSERFSADYGNTAQVVKWDEAEAILLARACAIIDELLGLNPVTGSQTKLFTLGSGLRVTGFRGWP